MGDLIMNYKEAKKELERLNANIAEKERERNKTSNLNERIKIGNEIARLKMCREALLSNTYSG